MASVNLTGTLTNPEGEPDEGAIVKFTLLTTTGNTVSSSKSQLEVPQDGLYDIDIVYGNLRVDYINEDGSTRFVAIVTVNGDTVATSLPELLNAAVPPTNAQLLEFQGILADAVTAQVAAEAAETGAVAAKDTAIAVSTLSQKSTLSVSTQTQVKPSRVAWGIDSITAGTPDSAAKYVGGFLGIKSSEYATFAPLADGSLFNVSSGINYIENQASRADFPKTHSLHGFGVYTESGVSETIRAFLNLGGGVLGDFHTARIFYLQQPSGGTFDVRQYSSDGTSAPAQSVDTSGVLGLASIDVTKNAATRQPFMDFLNINGDVALLGIFWMSGSNDITDHKFNLILAEGGTPASDWALLDSTTQTKWFTDLDIQTYIYNGGTNDRYTRTGAEVKADAATLLSAISASGTEIGILIPTQTFDYATTNSPEIAESLRDLAFDSGYSMFDIPANFGDYATISAAYGMDAGGVHPTSKTHKAISVLLRESLGLYGSNQDKLSYNGSGGGGEPGVSVGDPYFVDPIPWFTAEELITDLEGAANLYQYIIPAASIIGYIEIDITCRVNSGVRYFKTKRIQVNFATDSLGDLRDDFILTNVIKAEYLGGAWAGLDFTIGYSSAGNEVTLTVEPNFDVRVLSSLVSSTITQTSPSADESVVLTYKIGD